MKAFYVLILLCVPLCAACSAYHPLKSGVGFRDVPLGEQEYKVAFYGGQDMPVPEARQYALIRAAELATLHKAPYFQIEREESYLRTGSHLQSGPMDTFVDSGNASLGGPTVFKARRPDYVENYSVSEVWLQVKFVPADGDHAIAAGAILRQALTAHTPLSSGIAGQVAALPTTPASIPPAPAPIPHPALTDTGNLLVP